MVSVLRQALLRRRQRWESLCTRCGLCCYEKEKRGASYVTDYRRPCRFLDENTRKCTVYETRFQACAECRRMTIFHARFVPWLPESCGYVRKFRGRRGWPSWGWPAGSGRKEM